MLDNENNLTRASLRKMFVNASRELLLASFYKMVQIKTKYFNSINYLLSKAIEKAIALWEPSSGFLRLCSEIDAKCPNTDELMHKASAPLIRRAFIEGRVDNVYNALWISGTLGPCRKRGFLPK